METNTVSSGSSVFIGVDIQNDFMPGGPLGIEGGDTIIPAVNRCLNRFQHVVLTQDWHPPEHISFASRHPGKNPHDTVRTEYGEQTLWPDHCVVGSEGASFHPDLDVHRANMILRKGHSPYLDSYSGFFENDGSTRTGLAGYLRDRFLDTVFIGGLATDVCVLHTALDGRRLDFTVYVIEDAVRGLDINGSLARAWRQMEMRGVRRIFLEKLF